MELNLPQKSLASLVEALSTVSEQPVDIDFTLPDYCPDIEKILRCKITPQIFSRNISAGQLQVEGNTVISILYIDSEKGGMRACEQTLPFSASFRLNDVPEEYVIQTSVKCEYVNCRALSRRRLTVHGAFSLYAKVLTKGSITFGYPDEMENIEFKKKEINASKLCSLSSEQFSVTDEIQISGKPPVELIVDNDIKANITDYKIIPDKIMLNGELNVRLLYISDIESGKPEHLDYIIPFSEVIDSPGLTEDSETCITLNVMSSDLSLKSDILAENPLVNVDSRVCASIIAYSTEGVTIATDAYNTEFCSEPEFSRISIPSDTKIISGSFMHKDSLNLNDIKISEIIDFSASVIPMTTNINEENLVINSKVNIKILALNSDNDPVYIDRAVDVSKEIELKNNYNSILCSDLSLISISYRLGDNNDIEIRCEFYYSFLLQKNTSFNVLSALDVDDNKPLNKKTCALSIYYADGGENIWDIAKMYNTKQNLIISENELVAETLEEPTLLFIPTV